MERKTKSPKMRFLNHSLNTFHEKLGTYLVALLSYSEEGNKKLTLWLALMFFTLFTYGQCTMSNTNTASSSTSSTLVGQSFQATCDGWLTSVDLQSTSASLGLTLTVYAGEGTTGTALGSVAFGLAGNGVGNFESIDLTAQDIFLVDGAVYTLAISAGTPTDIVYSTTDDYAGGSFYSGGAVDLTADLVFQSNVTAYSLEACSFLHITTLVTGRAGVDTEGHLEGSDCNNEPAAISYLATSNPTPVFYFNIANGSATAESFSQFTIRRGNTVDLTTVLASAELFDGTNTRTGVISADNIVFSGLAPDVGIIPAESGTDQDTGKEFAMRVTFNSSISSANQAILDAQGLSFTFGGNAGDFVDNAGNGSLISSVWNGSAWAAFGSNSITGGTVSVTTSPTVQITGAPASVSSTSAFGITIQFSEDVSNFVLADVLVSNASTGSFVTVDPNTYTLNVTPDGTDNDIVIEVPSGVADDGTNGNILATPVTVPVVPAVTSVTRQSPAGTPTNADALTWRFTFTEEVLNLDATDFTINGTTATVSNVQDQTGGVYDITISGGDLANLDATVDISVNVSDITDGDGNPLVSGTPTGTNNNSYVVDNTLDLTSVQLNTPASSPTNADALTWRFTFTDVVTNLDATDFNVTGTTATVSNIQDQTGGVYDITISGGNLASLNASASISVNVSDIVDDAGNALSSGTPTGANNNSYVVDNTSPDLTSVALNTPASSPTNADALTWRFTFTDEVSNLDGSDFNVTGSTATVTNVQDQTGGVYDITISGGNLASVNGTVSIAVTVSDITDVAGNALSSATPTGSNTNSYVVDNTAPDLTSVVLNTPATSPTSADALTWRFTFTDVVSNLDGSDFNVTGSTATVTNVQDQTGGVYDITISGGNLANLDATVSIAVTVSDITDAAGNALSSGTPTGTNNNSYVVDNTLDLTSVQLNTPATSPTNADALTWRFTFTDVVSNLDATDFNVTGSTATVTGITDQTGGVYDITISGGDLAALEGTVSIAVTVSDIVDAAGNALSSGTPTGANNNSYVVDNTPPAITDINLLDTDFDGFIDRIDVVFNDNVDTDNSAVPVIGDFGNLILPDGQAVTGGTFSDPAGASNTVQITGITDQATATTAVGIAEINSMVAGAWVDDAGNAILATGADAETVNDQAAPAITGVTFYDAVGSDGLIDRLVITWSEATSAVDATLSSNEFTGFVTLPDGSAATFGSAVFNGNGTASFDITGITGQVNPATSTLDIYTTGNPVTLDIEGITTEFTDGSNPTSDPDDNESYTDLADPILIGTVPADDAPSASLGSNIVLAFSELVTANTGNITINETSGPVLFETISIASASGSGNDTITFNPSTDFDLGTDYHVLIDANIVRDAALNNYAGIPADATAFNFTSTNADFGAGDLAFTGYDENVSGDAFKVVLLRDFDGTGTPITITFIDDEWTGTAFNTNEGYLTWVIDGLIPAGTEILFTEVDNGSAGVAGPTVAVSATQSFTRSGSFNLGNADESLWAVVGTRATPEVFLSFIVNTDDANDVTSTSGTGLDADNTLNTADDFFVLSQTDDVDRMEYSSAAADRSGEMSFADYWAKLRDESTYWTANNSGTISATVDDFTIDNSQPLVASIEYNTPAGTPTNADALIWDVTFSDLIDGGVTGTAVTGVDAADFAVSGGTTATVTNVTGSGLAYQVTVSGGNLASFNGTVTLGFSGSQNISDAAGNTLDVAGSTPSPNEASYVVDNNPPTFGTNSISNATIDGFDINTQLNELGDVYWVVVADGVTAPSVAQVIAGQDNTGSAALDAGTINIDAALATRTGSATGLTSSNAFDVYIVGVDESGNQQAAVTLLNANTTTPDATSDAGIVAAFETAGGIDYATAANQLTDITDISTEGSRLTRISIRDFASGDNAPTIVTDITLNITGFANVRQLALYDGTSEVAEVTVTNGTPSFTGLSYSVADGAVANLDVYATFQANVTDNTNIQVTLNDGDVVASGTGSSTFTSPLTGGSSDATGTNNQIQVTASTYAYVVQPSDVTQDIVMSPNVQVEAVDALGSRDFNYSENVAITSDGTLSAAVSASIVFGVGPATSIVHTVAQTNRELTITGAFGSVTSNQFTVRPLDTDSDASLVTGGETSNIDYAANQQTDLTSATGVSLALIDLTDAGTQDQIATILSTLQLTVTNHTYLRQLALYDDLNNELAEVTVSGATVDFTGMSFSIPDGTTEQLTLRGSFTTAVTDNEKVSFTLTDATSPSTGASNFSGGAVSGSSSTSGTDNQIEVSATQLYFSAIEPQSFVNEAFAATIQAVDANLNLDLDDNSSFTISMVTVPGNISGTTNPTLSNGEVSVSDLAIDTQLSPHTIQASDGAGPLADGTANINITIPDTNTVLAASGALDETLVVVNALNDGVTLGEIDVFDFTISDAGTSDAASTFVTDIVIRQGTGNDVVIDDWTEVIAGATLTDNLANSYTATGITATTIVFGSMPTTGDIGEISDGTAKTFTLSITTQTTFGGSVATVFDNKFLEFEIDDTDITTAPSGSSLQSVVDINSGGVDTRVTADRLNIFSFPSDIYVDFNFSIAVEAVDANGNLDLNENSTVQITSIGSSPSAVTSASGVIQSLSGGRYTWNDLQVSAPSPGDYQFQIDDTAAPLMTSATSGTIATSTPDATSTLARVGGEQTSQIEYVNFQGAVASMTDLNTVEVLTFSVTDASGDGIPTIVNSIRVDELSGNSAMLRGVAIFDGSTRLGSVAAGATNTIPLSPAISVADGTSETFSVRVSFQTTVTDNSQFEFDINNSNVVQPSTASSTFTSINATSTTNVNDNTINVTATDIVITGITDPVIVGQNFNPTIEMRDTNGNVDLDFNSAVTASVGAGSASTAGIVDTGGGADQVTASNGVATYTALRIINGGGLHNIDFTDGGTVTGTYTGLLAIYNTSDIVVNNASTPTYIDYIQYDEATNGGTIQFGSGESIVVAEFTARDGGAGNDQDGLSTFITSIRVDLDADAQDNITALALFDNVGNAIGTQQTVSGSSVTFTIPMPYLEVADGTNETLILKATIDQGSNINDAEQMQFSIGQILDNAGGTSESDIADNTPTGIQTSTGVGDNTIDVIADRVIYTVDPSSTVYERNSENINFTVEAQDGNGNLDTDETSVLNITGTSVLGGTATILNGATVTLVGGTSAKTIQIDNEHEDLTLTVTDPGPAGSRTGATTISSAGNATLIDVYDRVDPVIVSKATDLTPFDGETDVTIASINTNGLRMIFSEEVAINPAGGNIVVEGNTSPITEQYILDILTDVTIDPDGDNPLEVELSLPSSLTSGVDYYVIIPTNTFRDDPNNNVNINGGGAVDDVNDFAGYLADTDWTWTMENVVSIVNASYTPTTITLEFNIPVQISGTATNVVPYFTLTDQGGVGSAISLVGATLTDGTGGDEFLELNVDLSGALGDVEITYSDPSAGAPDGISEDGNATVELADITAGSGPILNLDNTIPTLLTATEITTTDITLTFSEPVAIDTEVASDIVVEDGQGTQFAVTNWNDATPINDELELVVTNFAAAVGDLTITYNRTTSRIEDFGGNGLVTGQTTSIDRDVTVPIFNSISADAMVDPNRITMNFSEPIQSNGLNLADFVVTDGAAATYEVFVQVASGSTVLLTTADFSAAVGELTVTYNNNNNEVSDFGGNFVATNNHSIDLDVVAPTLTSVVKDDDFTITATFDESIQILNNVGATSYFTVVDEVGNSYPVTGQTLGASDEIVLSFADLSTAVGDLLVTYTDPASLAVNDVIADFSDNGAATVGPLTIDLNYTGTVTLTENALPPVAADDYAAGDTETNIAMFRTSGTANSSARTPVNIRPIINGSTIRIYSDPSLPQGNADLYFEATGVSNATGVDVRVDEFLSSFATGSDPIDFAGIDDNGIFTFYITEIAPNGVASEGPAVQYSLAFLDDIGNSLGITTFNENEDQTVVISLEHPTGQTLTFTGNALQSFMDNPGGTSTINFLVSAAVSGTNQINVSWRSPISSAEATFQPSELAFEINQSVDVFATTAASDRSFGRNDASSVLNLNTTIGDRDIDGAETAFLDFYTLEAYFVRNGTVLTVGSDGLGGTPTVGTTGVISTGNIASDILIYDGAGSAGGVNGRPAIDALGAVVNTASTFITNEWEVDPTSLPSSITNLFTSENRVDTIRLYTITRDDDALTPSYGQISNDEIYLYPDPTVFYTNLSAIYCQDEDPLTIQTRIFTYNGTGGIDSTGFIQNGYLLEYSADGSFAAPTQVNFSLAVINSVPGGVTNVNQFDPGDPLQDGSNVTGFFRIYYNTFPHTAANTVGQEMFQFEVRPKVSAPIIDLDPMATTLDANGGFDGGRYVFEFCSGVDVIPNINIDIAATGSDANAALVPNSSYNWYSSNGNLIVNETNSLDPTLLFASNPASGTSEQNIYVTRIVNGCESDSIPLSVRVYAVPTNPVINVAETVANDGNGDGTNEVNVNVDNDEYYFEYCAQSGASITYDQLLITTSLEDVPADRPYVENRTYFTVYDADATTELYNITNTGGPYTIDLATDPNLGISSTASTTADGFIIREFWISKVVADSTFTDPMDGEFIGCEGSFSKVTAAIYTYPEIPNTDLFTGSPRIDAGIVNYYMCAGEEFPDIGVDPPATATNGEANFEWFNNSDATGELTDITNRRGEVVTQADLENVTNATGFDATVPGTYDFYVRFRSNVNDNSGFLGCESGLRQVRLTVFPQSLVPTVTLDRSNITNGTVDVMDPDPGLIGNFDFEYNFCVEGFVGLDAMTEFESSINFPGTPTSGENEVLWFAANATGDAITGTNPIAEGDDSADPGQTFTVNAGDLQIQNSENDVFNFAVVHRADFFTGYDGFNGCFSNSVDTTYVRIIVSTTPEPQFSFSGITAGEGVDGAGTVFNFIDQTSIGSNVDFVFEIRNSSGTVVTSTSGNSDLSLTDSDFQYQFTQAGLYEGRLQITSSAGCQVETIRRFRILDKVVVTDSYGEGFESGDGGWFAEFQSDDGLSGSTNNIQRETSWVLGNPNGDNIRTTRSGAGSAWSTTGTTISSSIPNNYVGGEVSYVYSPAFDISALVNPAIRFSTFRDLDGTKDGVVFQYSVDDGITWSTLGSYDITNEGSPSSGQSWYNESAISTSPGDGGINIGSGFNDRRDGWAGQYTAEELSDAGLVNGWFESTHELDEIPIDDGSGNNPRVNVRFRFALSSSGAITDDKIGDGFGFDDMQIFQLGKNVLVEQFSSTVNVSSIVVGATVNSLTVPNGELVINYFTGVGNTDTEVDEINARNSTSPGARRAYYGIGEVPTTVLDGEVVTPDKGTQDGQIVITGPGWDDNDLAIKGLAPALFTMPLGTFGVRRDFSDAGTIAVTAQFEFAFDDTTFVEKDYSFIFAIVERQIDATGIGSYPDNAVIRNALRVLLPTPAGFVYQGDVVGDNTATTGTDESQVFEYSIEWDINNVYDASQLRVIAFAQDNESKEILQAGFIDINDGQEIILNVDGISDFNVYPNPADDLVTVEFADASSVESEWVLFDQAGREVFKGTLEKGTKSLTIKTSDIPSGLYFFNLYSEEKAVRARRIIVTH